MERLNKYCLRELVQIRCAAKSDIVSAIIGSAKLLSTHAFGSIDPQPGEVFPNCGGRVQRNVDHEIILRIEENCDSLPGINAQSIVHSDVAVDPISNGIRSAKITGKRFPGFAK